jgi:hypothetical protein
MAIDIVDVVRGFGSTEVGRYVGSGISRAGLPCGSRAGEYY